MRICVLSDIHGNGPAFKEALPRIESEGADLCIFLGDLCGYYFDQKEIYEMLRSIPKLIALRGNHDRMFLRILEGDESLLEAYSDRYGRSMAHLLEEDHSGLEEWLAGLPEMFHLPEFNMTLCHGSPWDPLEGYVYPDSDFAPFLGETGSVFLLGHTHYGLDKKVGEKWIVNPGSLGQPRGGGWPTYAVLDCSSRKAVFREVHYDRQALLAQIDRLDNHHPYLKRHLDC